MICISKDLELTATHIQNIVLKHESNVRPRLRKLKEYYKSNHEIKKRVISDTTKPNNKLINPYGNYITDMFVGYFVGEPIIYKSNDKDALKSLQMIFTYNDEQDHNSELAKNCSIYGRAYELLYHDSSKSVRFKSIDPECVIMIYDDTLEEELLYAIRYYPSYSLDRDDYDSIIEVYSESNVKVYHGRSIKEGIELINEYEHFFGLVPIVEYKNNEDLIGDFELVVSLIDAYDKLESDSQNDFEYFCDAYLALYGMDADEDDTKKMKQNRVLVLENGTKAEWLIKDVNDTQIENLKSRIDADIHKFAKCPALTDENFSANASGVAIKYKLTGMENVTSIKERKFKRGIQRRIELISYILSKKMNDSFDWRAIEIVFTRNLPANNTEVADMINKLRGMVSNETLISQLSFIEDVAVEKEKIAKESEFDTLEFGEDEDEQLLGETNSSDSGQTI